MRTAPCKDCTNRILGCHSTCEKYQEYAAHQAKTNNNRFLDHLKDEYFKEKYRKGKR